MKMNKYHIMAIICFISGAVLIGFGISRGEANIYWALFIPIFSGTGWPFGLGSLLLVLGFILAFIGFATGSFELADYYEDYAPPSGSASSRPKRKTKATASKTSKSKGKVKKARKKKIDADGSGAGSPPPYPHPPPGYYPPPGYGYWSPPHNRIRTGGVIFLGPIPIIWGSDKKTGFIMAVTSLIIAVIFVIFLLAWLL